MTAPASRARRCCSSLILLCQAVERGTAGPVLADEVPATGVVVVVVVVVEEEEEEGVAEGMFRVVEEEEEGVAEGMFRVVVEEEEAAAAWATML